MKLSVFHFEISGNFSKEEQPANKPYILFILLVFHFEISGNEAKELHPENRKSILTIGLNCCKSKPIAKGLISPLLYLFMKSFKSAISVHSNK